MNVSEKLQRKLDEGDVSIVTQFGRNAANLDGEIHLDELVGPQATSTVTTKKSRYDIIEDYVSSLEDAGGTISEEALTLTQVPCHIDLSLNNVQSEVRLPVQQECLLLPTTISLSCNQGSSGIGEVTSSSLINVDGLSDLSSSKFLVDHTQLAQKLSPVPQALQSNTEPDEYDDGNAAQEFAVHGMSDHNDSDLSEGEDEECKRRGLPAKYFAPSPEFLRNGTHGSMSDSHKLSLFSQPRSLQFGRDNEGKFEGLPSYLLDPQESLLLEEQISQENPYQLQESQRIPGMDRLSNISARSTMASDGLEKSKLLATSLNSIGSFGESAKESLEDSISGKIDESLLIADQRDLASMCQDEDFCSDGFDFLDEEEKQFAEDNKFVIHDSCSTNVFNDSCFSGVHGIRDITVRPSWIQSPDKELLGPGNRMCIDDYLKTRSEALGSLGDEDGEGRPDFGMGDVQSPPTKLGLPLVEISTMSQMTESYLQPDPYDEIEIASHETSDEVFHRNHSLVPVSKQMDQWDASSSAVSSSSSTFTSSASSSASGSSSSGSSTFQASPETSLSGAIHKKKLNDCSSARVSEGVFTKDHPIGDSCLEDLTHDSEEPSEENNCNAEEIKKLMSGLQFDDKAKVLLERIIQKANKKPDSHTLDVSELDASTEVLELRAMREALKSKSQHHLQEVKRKDEARNEARARYLEVGNHQPVQQPTVLSEYRQMEGPLRKHMERLKVQRTDSAPLNLQHRETTSENHPQALSQIRQNELSLEELGLDESLRGIPYKSRILEDSQKSQLKSFHDSTSSGFDSSTPCAPRNRVKESSSKGDVLSRNGNQIYFEDKRPPRYLKEGQRPLPRMGLASSLVKGTFSRNLPPTISKYRRIPADIDYSNESNVSNINLNTSRSESTIYPNSDAMSNLDPSDGESMRSSSMPSGLQSVGVASQSQSILQEQGAQSLQQHRSHENVASEYSSTSDFDGKFYFPKNIVFTKPCILGMGSEEVITFHNPRQRWVQLYIKLMQETVNNTPIDISALLFKQSYFVEPRSSIDIKLGLCSQNTGSLEAALEFKVSDLSKGLGNAKSHTSVYTVRVFAQIEEPSLHLSCDGLGEIDLGIVPESCIVSREVTVINQSPQSIPVLLTLQQISATSPVFYWNEENGALYKIVSPSCLAFELPPGNLETGPLPQKIRFFMKAPRLDKVKLDESGVYQLNSKIQVTLDTPNQNAVIISSIPIIAYIGALRLQTVHDNFVMETKANDSCTVSIHLMNNSTFPIPLSIQPRDHVEYFKIHPCKISVQPHSQGQISVSFFPKGRTGNLENAVLMQVEPDGLIYEIAITGKSLPFEKLMPPPLAPLQRTVSAPVANQIDLSSALESTKSRLVFSTVAVGKIASQKLMLRNALVQQALSLSISIRGSKVFKICEIGDGNGQTKMDVVLDPCQELSLAVYFSPTSIEAFGASVVFKPRGLSDPMKFQVYLQGYGGQSVLQIPDCPEGKPVIIRDISPHQSAMFHMALVNSGDREMFLKLRVFLDEECTKGVHNTEISVQPEEVVIKPKDNRDVFFVIKGSQSIISRVPGCLAFLQIISGDEILRRRFRGLRNKAVKTKRINDKSLLGIDWDKSYTGERDCRKEEMSFPLVPEDAAVFYNSCSTVKILLHGERLADEASSTVFAGLDAEDTMSSILDLSVVPERNADINSPVGLSQDTTVSAGGQPEKNLSWNIFPQTLTIPPSATSIHTFFVVNFTKKRQMFEVTSKLKLLNVEPQEAILPSESSVKLDARLIPGQIPQPLVTPITETLEVMCENECRCATITIAPDANSSNSSSSQNSAIAITTVTPPTPELETRNSQQETINAVKVNGIPKNPSKMSAAEDETSFLMVPNAKTKRSPSSPKKSVAKGSQQVPSDSFSRESLDTIEQRCLVEVVNSNLVYPDAVATKESVRRVKLRNLDNIVHVIKAKVTETVFLVHHHEFKIKPGHYVSVPVFFRPPRAGTYAGVLNLIVLGNNKILKVELSGRAS